MSADCAYTARMLGDVGWAIGTAPAIHFKPQTAFMGSATWQDSTRYAELMSRATCARYPPPHPSPAPHPLCPRAAPRTAQAHSQFRNRAGDLARRSDAHNTRMKLSDCCPSRCS